MRTLSAFGLVYLVACESDKSLTVQNPAPTADIISHDNGSEILEGFPILLEGLVSDSNHSPDQLTTTWIVKLPVMAVLILQRVDIKPRQTKPTLYV